MSDHAPFKTMGFCPTCERYTPHQCAKCQPAPDSEVERLRAENAELRVDYGEILDNLQAAADMFDDGSQAGNNLDEAIVWLLTKARRQLEQIDIAAKHALLKPGEMPLAEALHEIRAIIAEGERP